LSPNTIRTSPLYALPDCFCAFGGIVNGSFVGDVESSRFAFAVYCFLQKFRVQNLRVQNSESSA
jgi:hypothetical protein